MLLIKMRPNPRFFLAAVSAVGVVVGPAGCSDTFDLDPPNRVVYEGEFLDEVAACAEDTMNGAFDVNAVAGQMSIDQSSSPTLKVAGVTEYRNSGKPNVVFEWVCEVTVGDPGGSDIVSIKQVEAPSTEHGWLAAF